MHNGHRKGPVHKIVYELWRNPQLPSRRRHPLSVSDHVNYVSDVHDTHFSFVSFAMVVAMVTGLFLYPSNPGILVHRAY